MEQIVKKVFKALPDTTTPFEPDWVNGFQDKIIANFAEDEEKNNSIGNLSNLNTTDKDTLVNAVNEINTKLGNIIESGSNENGNYIKYTDGTMICYNTVSYENVPITSTWGVFYESTLLSLGDYAKPFTSAPTLVLTSYFPNFIEKYGNDSETSPGGFYACKPKSASGENVKVSYLAIGKWK